MLDKLKEDMKAAMKAKDKVRLDTIRGLLTTFQYERIQRNEEELTEKVCLELTQREVKKRRESLEFAKQGNRSDLIERTETEIKILQDYLPKQLTSEELEKLMQDWISSGKTSIGDIMKSLKETYAGQYDAKEASTLAKKLTSS